ncbi:4'-phosphopantetheinyl transferase superfamily protein (plasmid) [Massilia forsythiae]|uniref:Enterobactin synthase component D n=1 Tax=Massilia forsythiae TaxID=2728020 RepID=A0A7Z2W2P1_9BURK|nr:4'-phosphopantetheinyl transferase superfamily protein [Massilia forsythiae]QJE03663.1 4'-phosphopantetheinyl transferase superfamily protein [Massilia forsythiae]
MSTWLAARLPRVARCLPEAAIDSCFRLDVATAQAGLALDHLDCILAGTPLDGLPGMPVNAVRPRQLSYLAGRLCAERALAACGLRLDGGVGRGDGGEALWPEGFSGSISHTGNRAFAVVAARQGRYDIGIDAEHIVDDRTRRDIQRLCMCEDEAGLVAACPDPNVAATALFAAKEAYYKAVYRVVRRFVDFGEALVSAIDVDAGRIDIGPAPDAAAAHALPGTRVRLTVRDGMVLAALAPGYSAAPQP